MMHQTLQHPLWAIIYMICIVAVVFTLLTVFGHFSDMGILQSKNLNKFHLGITHCLLILSYIGVSAIVAFM